MKKYILIIIISLFIASCGESNGPDLEIKEDTVSGTVDNPVLVDTLVPVDTLTIEVKKKRGVKIEP